MKLTLLAEVVDIFKYLEKKQYGKADLLIRKNAPGIGGSGWLGSWES